VVGLTEYLDHGSQKRVLLIRSVQPASVLNILFYFYFETLTVHRSFVI